MSEPMKAAGGVQDLIARIRDEGVRAGRQEAERLVREAREEAARVRAEAADEARQTLADARSAVAAEREAALAALRTAARDTGLELRQAVLSSFQERLRRLVTDVTTDVAFVRAMVLVLAGRVAEEVGADRPLRVLVGRWLDGAEDDDVRERERAAVLSIADSMLREGVELAPSDRVRGGARVLLEADGLEFDLTDEAISALLAQHLVPRFRSILTGVEADRPRGGRER